ncbi:sensor histidine kinase [Ruminococcus albus]|uniref:histidine kinase n=1 Tax=Ruminococcus albus TaxID=1264 RepID=A0A1I1CZ27_RUMAL|nr:HAMP domain-containing sensor histidine kinase [Ruminococcus albus]SFB68009.1 Signal transduction histidine kinase [Ruminococcus albus]
MKCISLKLKLSLWFTLILTIVCAVILILVMRIYQSTEKKLLLQTLDNATDSMVYKMRGDWKYRKDMETGKLDDHNFLVDDVQLMVYNKKGDHIAGVFLYPELDEITVHETDKPVRTELDGRDYYYWDKKTRTVRGNDMYVRGIIAAEDDLFGSLTSHITILIALPVLLAMAFGGGYFITGRFLKPVRDIRKTAEEIRSGGDLSKRIGTSGNGDELDELANTINTMFDKLDKDFDAQKQFTSNASHELRTPVSVILAQCEYGFDHSDSAEELLQVVSSVQEQGYKMSGLIKLLLMFTRIDQGTEHYPKEETDLTELVHSVCEDMRIIADKNIAVTEKLDPVTAYVNREMLTLLTVNLIQNSLRYGKENGTVKVGLSESGNMAVLTVEDNGIGISAEDLPHIWERFYRSDRSRSSKGLGLGLALVKQIAGFHGGKVEVESTEGIGSRFIVKIIKQ